MKLYFYFRFYFILLLIHSIVNDVTPIPSPPFYVLQRRYSVTTLAKSNTATTLGITFHELLLAFTNPNKANCVACKIAISRLYVMW